MTDFEDTTRARNCAPGGTRCGEALSRPTVLWCGGYAPADLEGLVLGRGWRLRNVSNADIADGICLRDARALIIEVPDGAIEDPNIVDVTRPLINAALESGAAVVLVMEASETVLTTGSAGRVHRFCVALDPLIRPDEPRVTRRMREWGPIISSIEQHQPGPAASAALAVDGDVPTTDENEAEGLLHRAFHDADTVTLSRLAGGKSGASVWSVTPQTAHVASRASPFLVKYNTLEKTRSERSRYSQYADERVPYRLRPPIHLSRCVEGRDHGLLVFDFIDRAIPFSTALTTYPPAQLVGSLFGHTLAGCLGNARAVTHRLAPAFGRIKVLHWSDALAAAAAVAKQSFNDLPLPGELRQLLESLPPVMHKVGTAHGDLHTGNLLVAAGSSDVLLIDFGSIEFGMPVVTDPACLEISISFTPTHASQFFGARRPPGADGNWLRDAYRYPLDPSAVPDRYGRDSWIADAMRAVRAVARQLEPTAVPYAVATASYLIRFASYVDNAPIADRALAYELAAQLILSVDGECRQRVRRTASEVGADTSAHPGPKGVGESTVAA